VQVRKDVGAQGQLTGHRQADEVAAGVGDDPYVPVDSAELGVGAEQLLCALI
jgi:hypothetical protein